MTCPDFSGTSPFHLAIQEEALKCLSQCLRFLPKEILEIPDSQFRLPLHHAVQVGSIEACQVRTCVCVCMWFVRGTCYIEGVS